MLRTIIWKKNLKNIFGEYKIFLTFNKMEVKKKFLHRNVSWIRLLVSHYIQVVRRPHSLDTWRCWTLTWPTAATPDHCPTDHITTPTTDLYCSSGHDGCNTGSASLFNPMRPSCYVVLRILHCPLSGPDLIYISLLIISCIIEYVTNKRTFS